MLDIALKYVDELKKLYINTWHDEKYKYYHYQPFWEVPKFEDGTWNGHDFVSLNKSGEVIGSIRYSINRPTESACELGIINFTDDAIFGRDVIQAIKDIFEKYNFHKLSCCVVVGNPIEKTYDKLIPKYGGRIVGIEKQEARLFDNKYYDVKRYEIVREDYLKAKK